MDRSLVKAWLALHDIRDQLTSKPTRNQSEDKAINSTLFHIDQAIDNVEDLLATQAIKR